MHGHMNVKQIARYRNFVWLDEKREEEEIIKECHITEQAA